VGRCLAIDPIENGYRVTVQNCALCHMQQAEEPYCDMIRGALAGWMEAFLGGKAKASVEKECVAAGGNFCIFEITLP